MGARRRVLVLAYFFPPLGGAGVQRTLKFVRYLEPLGWDATVITTGVVTTAHMTRRCSKRFRLRRGSCAPASCRSPRWVGLVAARLRSDAAPGLGDVAGRGEGLGALRAPGGTGARPGANGRTSSSPRSAPYGAHLVAMWISRRTGIPWVADFRDEWASNPGCSPSPATLRDSLPERSARSAAASRSRRPADRFQLEGLAPDDPRRSMILNGVDAPTSQQTSKPPPTDRFVLANVGTVYDSIDPSPVPSARSRDSSSGERSSASASRSASSARSGARTLSRPGIRFEQSRLRRPRPRRRGDVLGHACFFSSEPSTSLAPRETVRVPRLGQAASSASHEPTTSPRRLVRDWEPGVVADPHDETRSRRLS